LATGVTSAFGRLRRARFTARLSVDLGALTALCAGVVVLASAARLQGWLPPDTTVDVLTLVAAAVGAGAALLALIGARLIGDPRLAWLAAALVLYCVVVLPWTLGSTATTTGERLSRLVAYGTALVLLAFALRAPRRMGNWGGWVIMLGGGLASLLALLFFPDLGAPATAVVGGPVNGTVLIVGWIGAAVLAVLDAARRQSAPRLRVGLGLVILAVAQLYRVANVVRDPATDLIFPALRVIGLVVVLVGLMQIVGRGLRNLQERNFVQQEELAVAALHMERAAMHSAERNHELRNGLAGLAGITHLLSVDTSGTEHDRLRRAVLSELGRLRRILDSSVDPDDVLESVGEPADGYLVEPMLAGLVTLRKARGWDITLDTPPGLRAGGDSAVAAQIVTNLLANCERHAAGTRIQVRAFPEGDRVVIEVRDRGPGLPPGREGIVLVRGVHDSQKGGSGLGLHISRELAEGQGGSLSLHTAEDPRGCVARLEVPAVAAEIPATDGIAR
jgi:two-component system OmpR family sensor kinase